MEGVEDFDKRSLKGIIRSSTASKGDRESTSALHHDAPIGKTRSSGETKIFVIDAVGVDEKLDQGVIDFLVSYAQSQCTQTIGHTKTFTIRWMERPPSDFDQVTASSVCQDAPEGNAVAGGDTDYCVVESTGVEKRDKNVVEFLQHLVRDQEPRPAGHTKIFRIRWMERLPSDPHNRETASPLDEGNFRHLRSFFPHPCTRLLTPMEAQYASSTASVGRLTSFPVLQLPPGVPPPPPEPRV